MTREEAIVIIENEKPHCGRSITFTEEEKCEAYEMAIAALKTEPCEVTWVTNNKGEGVAFKDMSIKKVNKIIAIMDDEPCDTLKLDGMLEDAYEHGYEQARHDFEVQPCEDAVSRKSVLEVVYNPLNIRLEKIIEKLPSVTPKQRTGKWIRRSIQSADCSVCGHIQTVYGQDLTGKCHIHKALFKFCPNCGAKMESEEKE